MKARLFVRAGLVALAALLAGGCVYHDDYGGWRHGGGSHGGGRHGGGWHHGGGGGHHR